MTDRSSRSGPLPTGHNLTRQAGQVARLAAITVSRMVHLTAGDARFRDDRGGGDPAVTAALAAFAAGDGTEQAALTALAEARLLVPVVAVLADDRDEDDNPVPAGGEKASESHCFS